MAEPTALSGELTDPSAFVDSPEAGDETQEEVVGETSEEETPNDQDEATADTEGDTAADDTDFMSDERSDDDGLLGEILDTEGRAAFDALPENTRDAIAQQVRNAEMGGQLWATLTDPERGRGAAADLITKLGYADLLQKPSEAATAETSEDDIPDEQFLTEGERKAYGMAKDANRRADALEARLAKVEEAKAAADAQTALTQKVDGVFKSTQAVISKEFNGFQISKDMLKEAMRRYPNDRPEHAVAARFSAQLFKYGQKVATEGIKPKNRGPEMVRGVGAKGSNLKLSGEPTDPSAFYESPRN